MASHTTEKTQRVTFELTTSNPLPLGEQIFIAGNHQALGSWKANAFPLTRMDDNLWTRSVTLPAAKTIEFKVTRGSWDSEELLNDRSIPANHKLNPNDDPTIRLEVCCWKDHEPAPPPQITGNYRIHESMHSKHLRFDRRVIVWLPPSYKKSKKQCYPVLYMHDGQQVFDPRTSTWNQDWEVDETCTRLIKQKKLQEIIVVAVYSTDDRFPEYDPAQVGDDYAIFMIEELKPFIDAEYRTKPGRNATAVAGSSMGGTISFYLAWAHPDIYSATACLSPAFKFKDNELSLEMARNAAVVPQLKIYLYCGEGDKVERELMPGMREMANILREKGFKDHENLLVKESPTAEHNEAAWAKCTDEWLLFLFGR